MSRVIRKSHNVSDLLYHLVFPAKYRRVVFDDSVEHVLRSVCLDISLRYEIEFIEIGTDGDHVQGCCRACRPTARPKSSRCSKVWWRAKCSSAVLTSKSSCGAASFGRTAPLCPLWGLKATRTQLPTTCATTGKKSRAPESINNCTDNHRRCPTSALDNKVTLLKIPRRERRGFFRERRGFFIFNVSPTSFCLLRKIVISSSQTNS